MSLASLLASLQLADSAFPSGRYTLSHGLESFAQSGALPSPRTRSHWRVPTAPSAPTVARTWTRSFASTSA